MGLRLPELKIKFPTWSHLFTSHRVAVCLYVFCTVFILVAGVVMCSLSLMWLYPYATETYTGVSLSLSSPTRSAIVASASTSTSTSTSTSMNMELTPMVSGSTSGSLSTSSIQEAVSYLNLVLTPTDINLSLILGVICCATFFASLPAYITHSTKGLAYLSFLLPFEALGMMGGSAFIWFRTLQERTNFWFVWESGGEVVQQAIQSKWECCGYWDASSAPLGSQCAAAVPALPACVDPFQDYADFLLTGVTTFMFTVAGFMGFWVLVNVWLIAERNLNERFRRIDEKAKYMSMYFV